MSRREFAEIFIREFFAGNQLRLGATIVLVAILAAAVSIGFILLVLHLLSLPLIFAPFVLAVVALIVEVVGVAHDAWTTAREEVQ